MGPGLIPHLDPFIPSFLRRYWYPLQHFLSLAFAPTMLIGLNKDFDMPNNFAVTCHAPPYMFAYPQVEEKKEDEKKLVATAVLSTTARAKVREGGAQSSSPPRLSLTLPRASPSPSPPPLSRSARRAKRRGSSTTTPAWARRPASPTRSVTMKITPTHSSTTSSRLLLCVCVFSPLPPPVAVCCGGRSGPRQGRAR